MKKIIAVVPLLVVLSLFLLPTGTLSQVTAQVTLSFESFANFLTNQPTATSINPTDKLLVIQGGVTKQAPGSLVTGGGGGGGGGVTTFNGRSGAVSPQTGDYAFSNISGAVAPSQLPTPTASTLGGVESGAAPGSEFVTGINTSGQLTFATPAGSGNVSTTGSPVTGNCAQFTGSTTITSAAAPCGSGGSGTNLGYVNITTFGAVGDGTCHALSGIYGSLAAAQAVYSFVSDLTQCVDWAATQKAINQAFLAGPTGNDSAVVYCPVGNYILSNPIFFDQANNSQGSFTAWASGATYGNGAQVTYNGIPWQSQGSGNIGNPPTSTDQFPASTRVVNSFPFGAVQISNASPAVVTTLTTHDMVANQPFTFQTQLFPSSPGGSTPVLPTGVNANQVYYVIGSSITGTTFEFSATPGGAAVNTSSTGVGVFFVNAQVWQVSPQNPAPNFSNRISFIGADGLPSASGCRFNTVAWGSPAIVLGPQNGNLIANISLIGGSGFSSLFYRCNKLPNNIGWAHVDNGGGPSRTRIENVGASGYYTDWITGVYGNGQLGDSNTWDKVNFVDACIGLQLAETQAFINTVSESNINAATVAIDAHAQQGVKVLGGNHSTSSAAANAFAISSVSTGSSGVATTLTATVTSPDALLQATMCAYAAGQAFNDSTQNTNYDIAGNSCGYNVFTIVTAHNGVVPFYVTGYNPFTKVINLITPGAWNGVYENTCCGTLAADLAGATKLYAAEMVTTWYGQIQVDTNHIEQGVPTTLLCNCAVFGGDRPAELKNVLLNSEMSLSSNVCCNQAPSDALKAQFYAQQTTPFINAFQGDTILDYLAGGFNNVNNNGQDRLLIYAGMNGYLEGRHTIGNRTNSAAAQVGPTFDFQVGGNQSYRDIANVASSAGQLSGGHMAYGAQAAGAGMWDNGGAFLPWSVNSLNQSSGGPSDMANAWRANGWGQSVSWGVRPAPYASPCITPSQATTFSGALPAITFQSQLYDTVVVTNGGSGYHLNDVITLAGGTFSTAAQVKVTGLSGSTITSVQVVTRGLYSVEPTFVAGFTQGSVSPTGGTGATFNVGSNGASWFVNYTIGYPMLWGSTIYHVCDYTGNFTPAGAHYGYLQKGVGYSYFQNLTTTNVPNLTWTMDAVSPFVYMNQEALELMFPGLVFSLTGSGGCSGTETFMVLEVHPTLGYVKVIRADSDGSPYLPAFAVSGTTCSGTTIGQAALSLANPY